MVIEGNWIAGAMAQDYPDVNWGVVEIPEGPAGRGDLRLHRLLRRRRRVAEPGGVVAGHRLPHRTGGCGGVDRGVQRDAGTGSRGATAGSPTIPSSSRSSTAPSTPRAGSSGPGFTDVITEFNAQFEQLIAGDTDVDGLIEAVTEAGESVL